MSKEKMTPPVDRLLDAFDRETLQELVEVAGRSDRRLSKLLLRKLEGVGESLPKQGLDSSVRKSLAKFARALVVEGEEAPDMRMCVAIESSRRHYPCSGLLWSRDVVLTAGHCEALGYRDFVVVSPKVEEAAKRYSVKASRRHPRFLGEPYFRNDVAILFLKEEVPEGMGAPSLATEREIDRARTGVVVGYGALDRSGNSGFGVRRKGNISILWDRGSTPRKPSGEPVVYNKQSELVAVAKSGRGDACAGDSGGPLLIATEDGLRFAAMVSRDAGMGSDPCGGGTIYVRLDRYKDWIEESIEDFRAGEGRV